MNPETALTITKYDGLEVTSQTALELVFSPFYLEAQNLIDTARTINVTDASQKRAMALARQCRLSLKDVRLQMLDVHKAQKVDVLIKGRAIDSLKNDFLDVVKPMEEHLLSQEQFAERIEAARVKAEQDALRTVRTAELLALGYAHAGADLGTLPEVLYRDVLADATAIKAEQDKAAADARAKEEERLRLQAENARLKAEAEEHERLAKIERERVAAEAKAKADEAARVLKEERAKAKAEADKVAAENARIAEIERKKSEAAAALAREAQAKADAIAKEKAEAVAAQLRAERRAREVAEAEIQAAKKSEADRLALEAEASRLAALAPESEKLRAFASALRALPVPDVTWKENIHANVENLAKWVEELIR